MKRISFLVALIIFSVHAFSQSLGYNDHRIAVSADGNNQPDDHPDAKWPRADPDDWGGTPAALAMIAKLGLQDKLVHYSYNNFIGAPPHTTETNYMADGVNGAIQSWDFNPSVFYDVPEDTAAAVAHLAGELKTSTASDPLYFIHMGLAEFLYRAVEQVVDSGKADALSHVYIISHSGFNENHLRRTYHRTMAEVLALSGDRLNYKKIVDQNACDSPNTLWCSGTDFSPFYWMRDHADTNIQWLYSRLQFHPGGKGADISDAGMVYYLTMGDEYGNLSKFETFIGNGIPTGPVLPVEAINITPDSAKVYIDRSIQLKAEITPSEAWNKKVIWTSGDNDIAYVSNTGEVWGKENGIASIIARTDDGGYRDTTVITVETLPECTDTKYVGIQDFEMAQIDTFVIAYKDQGRNAVAVDAVQYKNRFAATRKVFDGVNGFYNITLTTLTEEDGESTYLLRINNRLIGAFQNPANGEDMAEYTYTFPDVLVETGDTIQIESNTHSNGLIPEGDGFAFARGRWRSINFECVGECVVQETDGLLIFEAERFELKGFWKNGTDTEKASGGEYIYFDGPNYYSGVNQNHVISHTFRINNPGTYTFKWTMRQPEGERGTDKGNDVWVYFSGNIGIAKGTVLDHYVKFYSRSDDNFTFHGVAEGHDFGHSWLTVKFPSAGEYTLNIGGRSAGLQIDRIVLYKGISFDEAEKKLGTIKETSNCGNGFPPGGGEQDYFATPKSLTAPFLDSNIVIDGAAEEFWENCSWHSGAFEALGKNLPPEDDLSFRFRTFYNKADLFFLVSVRDDKRVKYQGGGPDYWNADNVELFFNPDNIHEVDGEYGSDAIQIRLNYGVDSVLYSGNGTWKGDEGHTGFEYRYSDNDTGYTIEAKIPWEGIFGDVQIETVPKIGFDVAVTDFDEGPGTDHTLTWANDTEDGREDKDTRKFGTMYLSLFYEPASVTGVNIAYDTIILQPGEIIQLAANIEPENASNQTVSWKTPDATVISLSPSNGIVKAIYPGTTTVIVTTQDGGKTDTALVIVRDPNAGPGTGYLESHDPEEGRISIIPNPATHSFRIQGIDKWVSLKVYSLTGQLLLNHSRKTHGELIYITELPSGFHVVCISSGKNRYLEKIVKAEIN